MTLFVLWVLLFSAVEGSTNIALGKLAEQSSTDGNAVASRAVDGNTDTRVADGSCSSTTSSKSPWWTVDLGHTYTVTRIKVTSSTDGSPLNKFYVEVAKENYSATEFWYELNPVPPGGVLNMVRPQGLKGRYVYLNIDYTDEIGATTKLTLCEVEVYGTAEEYFKLDAKRGAVSELLRETPTTQLECARMCLAQEVCRSFLWNLSTRECIVYSDRPTVTSSPDNYLGFVTV